MYTFTYVACSTDFAKYLITVYLHLYIYWLSHMSSYYITDNCNRLIIVAMNNQRLVMFPIPLGNSLLVK